MTMELNPKFETLFLLMYSQWGDEEEAEFVKALNEFGVDGQEFYNRNYHVVEKYITAFQKYKVESPGTQLLQDIDDASLIGVYADIFWRNPDWFDNIKAVPKDEVSAEMNITLKEVVEDSHGIIAALESLGLSSDTKWKIMLLRHSPKKHLDIVAAAVRDNLPAFEKARDKVSGELAVLLDNAGAIFNDPNKTRFIQMAHKMVPGASIVPTLAVPVAVMVLEDVVFYGLLTDKATNDSAEFTKEELMIGAKALSEKSKLEILMALKGTSLYGSEIAETIGLTAATVSHHMGTLIATRFLEMEKRNGKVYYRLAPKGIERFLAGVGHLLL